MSLLTAANTDSAILYNICLTLQQTKVATILLDILGTLSGISEALGTGDPLLCDPNWNPCGLSYATLTAEQYEIMSLEMYANLVGSCSTPTVTVQFFSDSARTDQLFSVNTDDDAELFGIVKGNKLYFQPTKALLNTPSALPLYYVTITETGTPDKVVQKTYDNGNNLLFSNVIVSTQKKPQFTGGGSTCIVVPGAQKLHQMKTSDQLGFMTFEYDLYMEIPIFDWQNMSEQARVMCGMNAANLIRLALYQDPYRNGTCTFLSADVDGTYVGQFQTLPSKDMLRGCINIKCAAYVSNTTY